MARERSFVSGAIFVFFLLLTSPAASQMASSGDPAWIGDEQGTKFIKIAGNLDANMPNPWLGYDPEAGAITVSAAGHDIWDQQDGCASAYVPVEGDFSATVRVDRDFTGPAMNSWAKAGVMVRDSVTPGAAVTAGSPYVFYCTTRGNGNAMIQWRDSDDAQAEWPGTPDVPAGGLEYPFYLRLVRDGESFAGYYSEDGETWTVGSFHANAGFEDPVYVGFALTSHEETIPTIMTFSDFSIDPTPEPLPDLFITDIWPDEGNRICYQLRNIGNAVAAAGHMAFLSVNGVGAASDDVPIALAPGERHRGCFDYEWTCTPPEDMIEVRMDELETDADITNNVRQEIWKCDTTPPQITLGPTVEDITQTSAVIVWETNEESSSLARYSMDNWAGTHLPVPEVSDPALVTTHSIVLTELEPSITYVPCPQCLLEIQPKSGFLGSISRAGVV